MHNSSITIKKAIEDRIGEVDSALSEGNKDKAIAECYWLKRDIPIYDLEIQKWNKQFQGYIEDLNAIKESAQDILNTVIESQDADSLNIPSLIKDLSAQKAAEKASNLQDEIDSLDEKISALESKIEEEIDRQKTEANEENQTETEDVSSEDAEENASINSELMDEAVNQLQQQIG